MVLLRHESSGHLNKSHYYRNENKYHSYFFYYWICNVKVKLLMTKDAALNKVTLFIYHFFVPLFLNWLKQNIS